MMTGDQVVGNEKNGGGVVIKLGKELIVRLPYHHQDFDDTGAYWLLDADGAPVLCLLGSSPGQTDHGIGTHQWRFRAVALGTTIVRMGYRQSWAGTSTRKYKLTVKTIAGKK